MSNDPRFARFEELAANATSNVDELAALAMEIGADLAGMRALVDRYAESRNLAGFAGIPLAWRPLKWSDSEKRQQGPQLRDLVFDYVNKSHQTDDRRTLEACGGALRVLDILRYLKPRTIGHKTTLGGFLRRSLDHDSVFVVAEGLQVLHGLVFRGDLRDFLVPSDVLAVRERVARVAEERGDEFENELNHLRGFLQD